MKYVVNLTLEEARELKRKELLNAFWLMIFIVVVGLYLAYTI